MLTNQEQEFKRAPRVRPPSRDSHTVIKFLCGCGFRTASLAEAEEHAQRHSHTIHISGEVRPLL